MHAECKSTIIGIGIGNKRNSWRMPKIGGAPHEHNHHKIHQKIFRHANHGNSRANRYQRANLEHNPAAGNIHDGPTSQAAQKKAGLVSRRE